MPGLYNNAILNQVTLPTGTTYDVNDATAVHYLGKTSSNVASGTVAGLTILIGSTNVTPTVGDTAIYVADAQDDSNIMYRCTAVNPATTDPGFAGSTTWECVSPKAANISNATITLHGEGTASTEDVSFTLNQATGNTYTVASPITDVTVNGTSVLSNKVAAITLPTDSMVFKGTVGDTETPTSATIDDVPVNGSAKIGDTYKVVTKGKYANNTINAEVGDLLVCLTKTSVNTWVLIPSGDDVDVQSVATSNVGITTLDGQPITTSGTIKLNLASETRLAQDGVVVAAQSQLADRTFAVGIDKTNGNLAVTVPTGTLANTVSDATAGTAVTNVAASAAGTSGVSGSIAYCSVAEGSTTLTFNYITVATANDVVFNHAPTQNNG